MPRFSDVDQDERNYQKFLNTYSGKRLLEKHKLTDYGIWQVYGEDPNCDLGGSHVEPRLFTQEGILKDIIWLAANTPNFWQWGSGGRIELLQIRKVPPMPAINAADIDKEILNALISKTEQGKLKWQKDGMRYSARFGSEESITAKLIYHDVTPSADPRECSYWTLSLEGGAQAEIHGGDLNKLVKLIEQKPGNDLKRQAYDLLAKL